MKRCKELIQQQQSSNVSENRQECIWTKEQDRLLKQLVSEYEERIVPWMDIANYFQGKTPAECRYHYTRHLMLKSSDSDT